MVDPIDEYAVQQLKEYDGKKLVSVSKEVRHSSSLFDALTVVVGAAIPALYLASRLRIQGGEAVLCPETHLVPSQLYASQAEFWVRNGLPPSCSTVSCNATAKLVQTYSIQSSNASDISQQLPLVENLVLPTPAC